MPAIECITLSGQKRVVQEKDLILRPAVYAIVVNDNKILLLRMSATGKYHLPGGGIKPGERMNDTLKRELWEETGIKVKVGKFVHFEEHFFYYDPSHTAYHGLHFYYVCTPETVMLLKDDQVVDESAGNPRWIDVRDLKAEDFQTTGEVILDLCRKFALQHQVTQ